MQEALAEGGLFRRLALAREATAVLERSVREAYPIGRRELAELIRERGGKSRV